MKNIAIIGGAGPEAGSLLFRNLITAYQTNGAWQDHDFPRIMLLNMPFSPMLESATNQITIIDELQSAVDIASRSGNEVVAIACNTLHSFVSKIDFKRLTFVSIVDVVHNAMQDKSAKRILFLGTKTSVSKKIYERAGIEIVYPSVCHQDTISESIVRILRNTYSGQDSTLMSTIIDACADTMNFDGVILGCTELSVIHQQWNIKASANVHIFDSIHILARRLFLIK